MKNMRIRSQFLLIVLPLILCSYVILIISTNLVFYQDIVVKQQKEVWDEANIVASQIERAFTNIASCCKVISRDFNYDENKLLVTQKPKSVLEEYQKDLAIRSVLYSNEIFFDEVETLAFIDQDRGLHVSDTWLEENWSEEACDALLALPQAFKMRGDIFHKRNRQWDSADTQQLGVRAGKYSPQTREQGFLK